jgi:hypothetical protein
MNLLHKYFLVILMLFSFFSLAQDEKTPKEDKKSTQPKNEIRLIVENFFGNKIIDYAYYNSTGIYYSYDASTNTYFNNRFRYGLGYNFNFNRIGFRTKLFYSNYNETSTDSRNALSKTTATIFRGSLGVNYQKHLNRIVLFIGSDFGYFKSSLKYNFNTNTQTPSVSNQTNEYSGISIQPLVGFKYFFNENFSISSEIRFIIDKYSGVSDYTFDDSNGYLTNSKFSFDGTSTQLGPLGSISLNVHF